MSSFSHPLLLQQPTNLISAHINLLKIFHKDNYKHQMAKQFIYSQSTCYLIFLYLMAI